MDPKGLVRLQIADVPLAVPIAWTIFDEDGNVACRPGFIFRTREEFVNLARATPLFRADPKASAADAARGASKRTPVAEASDVETTLDDITLHIGENWQLQPLSDFDQHRYYVKLVGYLKGASVIVTTPTVDGKTLLIRDGQPFIVRAFSGKSAYAFKTAVTKSIGSPFAYLHLAYPETVRGMIVRQSQRITVSIITAVTPLAAGFDKTPGMIKNVSKSGVSLHARAPIGASGDRVSMSFQLNVENHDYMLVVEGILRAIRPTGTNPGDPTEYGIQLVDIKPIDQLVLTAFCNAQLANADTG